MELRTDGLRTCPSCDVAYPQTFDFFYAAKDTEDGLKLRCKGCVKKSSRNNKLKFKFGIDQEEYDALLIEQNGVCAICSQTCITGRALAVDHNHDTGVVRGLVCYNCNIGIGKFQEASALLFKAAKYVKEFEC